MKTELYKSIIKLINKDEVKESDFLEFEYLCLINHSEMNNVVVHQIYNEKLKRLNLNDKI